MKVSNILNLFLVNNSLNLKNNYLPASISYSLVATILNINTKPPRAQFANDISLAYEMLPDSKKINALHWLISF